MVIQALSFRPSFFSASDVRIVTASLEGKTLGNHVFSILYFVCTLTVDALVG